MLTFAPIIIKMPDVAPLNKSQMLEQLNLRMIRAFVTAGVAFLSYGIAAAQNEPIKVGATLALSGKLAFAGVSQQQGLQLAIEDANRLGGVNGRPLQLLADDNAGEPKAAVSSVNKLIEFDKVDVLFSPFSHITQAIKDLARRSGKIMIYAASLSDVAKESNLFFRDWGDAESQGATLAGAVATAGYKTAVFLTETSEGCLVIQKSFKEAAAAKGISVLDEESYAPGETDFKPILLRIARRRPQAIATCTWRDSFLIMPQLKNLGLIGIPMFQYLAPFVPASDAPEIRKLYQENNTVAVWLGFVEGELTEKQKVFFDRFGAKYGSPPRLEAALAYDDVMVLVEALKACPVTTSVDSECTAKALQRTNYLGVAGSLRFDDSRLSNRPDLLIQVKDGTWATAD